MKESLGRPVWQLVAGNTHNRISLKCQSYTSYMQTYHTAWLLSGILNTTYFDIIQWKHSHTTTRSAISCIIYDDTQIMHIINTFNTHLTLVCSAGLILIQICTSRSLPPLKRRGTETSLTARRQAKNHGRHHQSGSVVAVCPTDKTLENRGLWTSFASIQRHR